MWYSGLACCIVVVLGACLSLVPGLQQENHPDQDLLVPVMEVTIISLNFLLSITRRSILGSTGLMNYALKIRQLSDCIWIE